MHRVVELGLAGFDAFASTLCLPPERTLTFTHKKITSLTRRTMQARDCSTTTHQWIRGHQVTARPFSLMPCEVTGLYDVTIFRQPPSPC
jgi:hypothetical protein